MDMNVMTTEAGDQSARWGFVKKVYLGVLVQLIFTIVPVYSVIGVDILPAVNHLYGLIPLGISVIVLLCFKFIFKLRHTVPYNYICMVIHMVLTAFTFLFFIMETQIHKIIIGTAIAQLFCAFLLALLGVWRITTLSLYLIACIGVVVLIILFVLYATLLNIVILLVAMCCGTLLSSFHLLFDNQLTVATNSKYAFNIDEYLWAAMSVYNDIMQLVYFLSMMVDTAFKISAKKKKQIV